MSDNSKRPLTRREIREREQAAAAAAAAQAGGQGAGDAGQAPAAQSRPAFPASYGTRPAEPFPAPPASANPGATPPSRRALREQAAAHEPPEQPPFSAQAPVVRPPSTSGGVRRVDETGRLTPVQRPSGDAEPRPAAPFGQDAPGRAGAPQRTTSRQPFSGPPAPSAAFGRPTSEPPAAAPAPTPPPSPWASSTPEQPSRNQPPSPFGTPASGGSSDRPSSSPSLPWETPSTAAPAPAPGAQPGPPGGRTSASPFDALVSSEHQPSRARAEAPVEDDDEDDWEEPESSYTWLHYIVLVVVAFVLGLLVWKLLLDGPDESFQTDQQAATAVTTLHTVPDGGVL